MRLCLLGDDIQTGKILMSSTIENVQFVGIYLRAVPNPIGDCLVVLPRPPKPEGASLYAPGEVLRKDDVMRVYGGDQQRMDKKGRPLLTGMTLEGLLLLSGLLKKDL